MKRITLYLSGHIVLTPLDETNYALLLSWRNIPSVRRWFLDTRHISASAHRRWFESYLADDSALCWIACSNGQSVGTVSLTSVVDNRAEIGRLMVDPAHQGQGLGALIERAAMAYAFRVLGLSQLVTSVKVDNVRTLALVASCGFRETHRTIGVIHYEVAP